MVMPIKNTKKLNKKSTTEIYQKIKDLENKIGRMNTLYVYINKVMQMEKRLAMINVNDHINTDDMRGEKVGHLKNIEKKLFYS